MMLRKSKAPLKVIFLDKTLQSDANNLEVVTLTSWESKEDQQVWFHSQKRQKVSEPTTTGSF